MFTRFTAALALVRVWSVLVAGVLIVGSAPAFAVTFTVDTYIAPDNLAYDGQDVVVDNCTVTIDGSHTFNSLAVVNAGAVTHTANGSTATYSLNLAIAQDVTVESAARIHANGRGFAPTQGPGAGATSYYSAGAGHGGRGAESGTFSTGGVCYGSIAAPTELGSGGGQSSYGGRGGGAIRLLVGGTLLIDGQITANGNTATSSGGGGSGGSIYLTAETFAGSGTVAADGGNVANGDCGSGGGGRIAIEYVVDAFTGTRSAHGGSNGHRGGAGTIYSRASGADVGTVVIDNSGITGAWTPLTSPEAFSVLIANNAIVYPDDTLTLTSLHVAADGFLTHLTGDTAGLNIDVLGDTVIDTGGAITATGRGYAATQGPGAGATAYYSAGAGHGGLGGSSGSADNGGAAYDSILAPAELGSGGGQSSYGGRGGGLLRLTVGGALTVDGELVANGNNATSSGGGGAGGSIDLTVGTLNGDGSIAANGGQVSDSNCGCGAGGRITVEYGTMAFAGTIAARGGTNGHRGGAGTVYTRVEGAPVGDLRIDNDGVNGAWTPLTSPEPFNLVIANNAIVYPTAPLTVTNLDVLPVGYLTHWPTSAQGLNITVDGNATIAVGGYITADTRGYAPVTGPGAGTTAYYSSGAGYGGNGGDSASIGAGGAYGSVLTPGELGSGGGHSSYGGRGGGLLRMIVAGMLQLDGNLSANGGAASSSGGGGSGGAIHLTVGSLSGSGVLTANGGNVSDSNCGSGAGGRIAIEYGALDFTGTIAAHGGTNGHPGGAGTIYTRVNGASVGQLLIDNDGTGGAWTPITSPEAFFLTIADKAYVYPAEALALGGLAIAADGLLTHPNAASGIDVTVQGDALVAEGGAISVKGRGYAAQSGPGAGSSAYYAAGGGHGGNGGISSTASAGGAYDAVLTPTQAGSGGGNSSGGRGGGIVRLVVSGTLLVDGQINADGSSATSSGGGGAGGSIYLTVDTLAGSGSITANGGAVSDSNCGGGAGGRIAIEYETDAFDGLRTARGGHGHQYGGAGSVYTRDVAAPIGHVHFENGGHSGAWTPITSPEAYAMSIASGAIAYPTEPVTFTELLIDTAGLLTHSTGQTGFDVTVTGDAVVATDGLLDVSGRGYGPAAGPGAGGSGYYSAGGGHGGRGGNSSTSEIGGGTYDLVVEPTMFGSGGGSGSRGGRGGGAVRLRVGETCQVDGAIRANGLTATSSGGGGAGGSLYLTVGSLLGDGTITAIGGGVADGNCGGGGGGRIAIYTADLQLDLSQIAVTGGAGYHAGELGTIYIGTSVPLRILSHTPTEILAQPVDHVDIQFNVELDPTTFSADDVILLGPDNVEIPLAGDPLDLGNRAWRLSFAPQTADGPYTLHVGPHITDLLGGEMDNDGDGVPGEDPDDVYVGTFTIDMTWPEIIAQSPTGTLTTYVDHIDLTFSEPVFNDACPEGGLTLTGPQGDIAVADIASQGNNVWRVSFLPQITAGDYTLTIAPDCFVDQAGNPLATTYVAAFTLAPEPGAQVLVITVNGGYNPDGYNLYQTVVTAGANAVYVVLSAEGQVTALLADNDYDQVWIYDLSSAVDAYTADWQAIADWFAARAGRDVICDARIISSYWNGRWTGEGQNLSDNYYQNLKLNPAGGLVLGTDHSAYQSGINTVNTLLGLQPFCCEFSQTKIPVDTEHPLMTMPHDLGVELWDDSSPGQTPYGLQASGHILYTVAWHSDNPDTPGISSTIEGGIGFHVDIMRPADGASFFSEQPITFLAVPRNGVEPITYEWSSSIDGVIGSGATFDTATLSGGEHTITVLAEDDDGRDDDDTITITIINTPDLEVTAVAWLASPQTGQPFDLSWTITNTGRAAATGPWQDRVYISPDDVYGNGNDVLLWQGTFPSGLSVEPAGSYDRDGQFTAPPTPGDYWIIVVTDTQAQVQEGVGEDNNVYVASEPLVVEQFPLPDLAVIELTAPTQAVGGETVIVEYTVENIGLDTAFVNWQDAIFLSDDATLDSGDDLLRLNPMSAAPLAPGESYVASRSVTLPVSYVVSTAYLIVVTDRSDVIDELSETNNVLASDAIEVTITPAPDLVAHSIDAPPTAVFGEDITVAWSGENIGTDIATSVWSDLVFLSADQTLGTSDRYLGLLSIDAAPLAPGDPPYTRELTVTLPLDLFTATGDYYVLVKADGNDAIEELDEQNNVAAFGPVYVELPPLPNLVIGAVEGPATAAVGTPAHVTWYVENTGGEPVADSFLMTIYVTPSGELADATPLANVLFDEPLPAGESVAQSADVTIPELATSSFKFLICADTVGDVLESDESDNCTASEASTPYDRPDLVVESLVEPPMGVAGDLVAVSWTIRNAGAATAVPYWIDAVYLSFDDKVGSDLLLRTEAHSVALGLDATYTVETTVRLPDDLTGVYYVIVETDRGNRVIETGEPTNNYRIAAGPTEVAQPDRPNLVVTDITTPAPGIAGQSVAVTWTVTNQGLAPAEGFWIDRVIASRDAIVSADDIVLGTAQSVMPLLVGESYVNTATFHYPLVPDDYTIIVTTDAMNAVNEGYEGGEDDNTTADDDTFAVTSFTATADAEIDDALAGTPVTITGQAFREGTTEPAVDVPVVVRVVVRGFERRLTQRSDSDGTYSVVFKPGPTEGGLYEVSAGPEPAVGLPIQDEFRLWSLLVIPDHKVVSVYPGVPKAAQFSLKNPGDLTLTGIEPTVSGAPAGVDVQVQLPERRDLLGLATETVQFVVTAAHEVVITEPIYIDFTTDQGATARFALLLNVAVATPTLSVVPEDLTDGAVTRVMVRGERSYAQFRVRNVGGAATGALNVQLPSVAWMSLATPTPMAPLAPGATAAVVVQLDPPADLPLGPYTGTIAVQGTQCAVGVPFRFVNTSEGLGDLLIRSTDEFTYYAAGNPPVIGAHVVVTDHITEALVAEGYTDATGELSFENLTEAWYDLEVTAAEHGTFRTSVLVVAAETITVEAFMPRQVVSYRWTVVPFDFEDEYHITITAEFETEVPAPVVVIEPASVDLAALTLPAQVNFTVTNYGLITARNVQFDVQGSDAYELIPLVTEIGDLPGGCTPGDPYGPCRVAVPVLIVPTSAARSSPCDPIYVWECHELECGDTTYTYCGYSMIYHGSCPPGGSGGGGGGSGGWGGWGGGGGAGGGGGGGGPAYSPPVIPSMPLPCDPCDLKCATSALSCIPGVGCPLGLGECAISFGGADSPRKIAGALLGCAGKLVDCAVELSVIGDILSCACALLRDCVADCEGPAGSIPCSPGDVLGTIGDWIAGSKSHVRTGDPIHDYYEQMYYEAHGMFAIMTEYFGDSVWLSELGPDDAENYRAWIAAFELAINEDSDAAEDVSDSERQTLLSTPRPAFLTDAQVIAFIERWNRSLSYWDQGILTASDLPEGWNPDFIDYQRLWTMHDYLVAAEEAVKLQGFDSLMDAFMYARDVLIADRLDESRGICATVRIQIDQTATVTRTAFRATLELENNGVDPLEAILVDVHIQDDIGQPATDRFGVYPPELTGALSAVDGTGSLAGGAIGTASWVILPTDEAAPLEPQAYYVGGTLMYELNGDLITIPLYPVRIDVLPNPNLELKYFLETVVYSDDPFTPEIEPAIPFSLGLQVKNSGAGVARNMQITSAQPRIVDNDRELLIDFDIIGTQVGLDELAPSLTVMLGDIGPDAVAVARWLMIATLQGEFVSYEATFEHVDSLGDPRLSIIESVDIFGLNHVVLADVPESDGLPDFLTNDFPDPRDLPDRVHLSDGTVAQVLPKVDDAVVTTDPEHLSADISVAMPEGWAYIRIDDPYAAQYRLNGVTRSDGKALILNYNAWQTNRVNRFAPGDPVERFVHLFDQGGDGHYTLTFDPDGDAPDVISWQSVANHGPDLGEVGLAITPGTAASDPRAPGVSKLVITFSEAVLASTFDEAHVYVDGYDILGQEVDLSGITRSVTLHSGDTVGVVQFTPALPVDARYCIVLAGVTDRSGNPLVGDHARIDLTSLPGDATGDRRVNNTDVGGVGSLLGTDPLDRAQVVHVRSDVNCDGRVDEADLTAVISARGHDARFIPNPCLTRQPVKTPGSLLTPSAKPQKQQPDACSRAPAGREPRRL